MNDLLLHGFLTEISYAHLEWHCLYAILYVI